LDVFPEFSAERASQEIFKKNTDSEVAGDFFRSKEEFFIGKLS